MLLKPKTSAFGNCSRKLDSMRRVVLMSAFDPERTCREPVCRTGGGIRIFHAMKI